MTLRTVTSLFLGDSVEPFDPGLAVVPGLSLPRGPETGLKGGQGEVRAAQVWRSFQAVLC